MKKMNCMWLVALVLLVGAGLLPSLGGAAMIKLSVNQLAAEADTIVLATVTNQVSAWNAEHTAIYTDVTIEIDEAIKGSPGEAVTFRIAGGIVGEIGMRTSNDPVFSDGEQVIVFLGTEIDPVRVVGLFQGKYTVTNGTVTKDGQTIAVADFMQAIQQAASK
jgi:hypothetical protein